MLDNSKIAFDLQKCKWLLILVSVKVAGALPVLMLDPWTSVGTSVLF